MKFKTQINVMPLKELLDPQGKAVHSSLQNLDFKSIKNVRIGKHIEFELDALDENEAKEKIEKACKQLLVNEIIEYFEFTVNAITEQNASI